MAVKSRIKIINDKVRLLNCEKIKKSKRESLIWALEALVDFCGAEYCIYHHDRYEDAHAIRILKHERMEEVGFGEPLPMRENVEIVIPKNGGIMNFFVFSG